MWSKVSCLTEETTNIHSENSFNFFSFNSNLVQKCHHLQNCGVFRFIGGTYGRIIGRAMVDMFGVHSIGTHYLYQERLHVCFLPQRQLDLEKI